MKPKRKAVKGWAIVNKHEGFEEFFIDLTHARVKCEWMNLQYRPVTFEIFPCLITLLYKQRK